MDNGHLYFLTDQYCIDFSDPYLMRNKETINGVAHNRPCYFAFEDITTGLYWMIPLSSQVEKYRAVYNQKVNRYGRCDTIDFCNVLGHEKAFLIQNMCPVNASYINNEYFDYTGRSVRINSLCERRIVQKAKRVLALQRQGKKFIFPDVLKIEGKLSQLSEM